jgi:hypothetical protein
MTNKQDLYNVLFKHKTELQSQRIELALIDDLTKQANNASKLSAENIILIDKVRANFKESLSILNKVEIEAQKAYKIIIDLGLPNALYKEFLDNVKSDISINNKLLQKYS